MNRRKRTRPAQQRRVFLEQLEARDLMTVDGALAFGSATFYGGGGNQSGMDVAVHQDMLYVSGRNSSDAGTSLALSYALDSGTPDLRWAADWPPGEPSISAESFDAVIPSDSGVYLPGTSTRQTTDGVGGTENKSVVVKLGLDGATGADVGGADWVARPHFFSYRGHESLRDGVFVEHSQGEAIYAVGTGEEVGFGGSRALITKVEPSDGSIQWKGKYASSPAGTVVAGTGQRISAQASGAAWLNGHLYLAGSDRDATRLGGTAAQGMLLKMDTASIPTDPNADSDGAGIIAPIWTEHTGFSAVYSAVAASGNALYVAGYSFLPGNADGADFLVRKYDEAGSLLWSRNFGGDGDDRLTDVVVIEDRVLAVGHTASEGSGGQDMVLLQIDSDTGATLDQALYGGPLDDRATALAVRDQDVYVVGETRSFNQQGNTTGELDLVVLHYRRSACPLEASVELRGQDLLVCGTTSNDRVIVTANDGEASVRLNGEQFGPFDVAGSVIVLANDGDDRVVARGHTPVVVYGQGGNDYLAGGNGDDLLVGGPGNDRVLGGEGHNELFGDGNQLDSDGIAMELPTDGDDRVSGRSGDDILFGGGGRDQLLGSGGNDYLHAGTGNDFANGGLDDDVLIGAAGEDTLSGYYGNDLLLGGAGADHVYGRAGNDLLIGGDDADQLRGDTGDDLIIGGIATHAGDTTSDAALRALLADWTTARPAIPAGLGLLLSDGAEDLLTGDRGRDVFHDAGDWLYDLRASEGDIQLP